MFDLSAIENFCRKDFTDHSVKLHTRLKTEFSCQELIVLADYRLYQFINILLVILAWKVATWHWYLYCEKAKLHPCLHIAVKADNNLDGGTGLFLKQQIRE
jgi:hypothetical protein